MKRWAAALLLVAGSAHAVVPTSPAPPGSAEAEAAPALCRENFPPGSTRPKLTESFPDRGKSGYALVLDVTVEHGKGETVLPSGVGAKSGGDEARLLEQAGFYLPHPGPEAGPKLDAAPKDAPAGSKSRLRIPVVALPKQPGRSELELPPLPIAIARASGEVRTLCTSPHRVIVEDPTANAPDAKPKGNPLPLRQREEWTAAKHAAYGAAVALVVGTLVALLFRAWRRRPRPAPPPPPPRPPWEVALEELFDVRIAQLVEQGRYAEHFDRVSDAVRRYLGARYGFDGLETTTHEAMFALRRVQPYIGVLSDVEIFLQNADLVKFAKLTPTEAECHSALSRAEEIVRRTMPAMASVRTAVEPGRHRAEPGPGAPPPPAGGAS